MSGFVPCVSCRRHIRSREARCVFCGAEASGAGGSLRTVAILSAAALTLVACKDPAPSAKPEPSASAESSAVAPAASADPIASSAVVASASAIPTPSASASVATPGSPPTVKPTPPAPTPTRNMATRYGLAPKRNPDGF